MVNDNTGSPRCYPTLLQIEPQMTNSNPNYQVLEPVNLYDNLMPQVRYQFTLHNWPLCEPTPVQSDSTVWSLHTKLCCKLITPTTTILTQWCLQAIQWMHILHCCLAPSLMMLKFKQRMIDTKDLCHTCRCIDCIVTQLASLQSMQSELVPMATGCYDNQVAVFLQHCRSPTSLKSLHRHAYSTMPS